MASRVQIVIDVDADKAGEAVRKVNSALGGMEAQARQTTQVASRGFGDFEKSMFRAVVGANLLERAASSGLQAIQQATVGSALLAAQDEARLRGLEALTRAQGQSTSALTAARAQIESMGFTAESTARNMALLTKAGVSLEKQVELANVAQAASIVLGRDLADTYERLSQGSAKQETELVDELGFKLDLVRANREYAASLGKTSEQLTGQERTQAAVNSVLAQGAGFIEAAALVGQTLEHRLSLLNTQAERAQIALGAELQDELETTINLMGELLSFTEQNATAIVETTQLVLKLALAYGTLRLAIVAAGRAQAGAALFDTAALAARIRQLETLSTGGKIGVLAAAAAAAGFAADAVFKYVVELRTAEEAERNGAHATAAQAAALSAVQERFAGTGVELKKYSDALDLLNRLASVNSKRLTEGLGPLEIGANLTARLAAEERRLAGDMEASGEASEKLIAFRQRLAQIGERAELGALPEVERPQRAAQFEAERLIEEGRKVGASRIEIEAGVNDILLKGDQEAAALRVKARESLFDETQRIIDRQAEGELDAIGKVMAARDREVEHLTGLLDEQVRRQNDTNQSTLAERLQIIAAQTAAEQDAARKVREIHEQEAEKILEARQRVADRIADLEARAADATLDVFERIERQRRATIAEVEGDINTTLEQIERARVAASEIANAEIRDEHQRAADEASRAWERAANDYDRVLDRMVRFTRQSGSFLTNIWRAVSEEFQRGVTKMVLSWLLGLGRIRGSVAGGPTPGGGGGGQTGGLLGSILFGGVGAAPTGAATPPIFGDGLFGNAAFGTPGFGGGFPASTAAGAGGIPNAVPVNVPGSQTSLPGIGQLPGGQGALLGLLLGLEGARRGRPVLAGGLAIGGVLGGVAASGAAAGIAGGIGGLAGAGVGLAAFLTNPVGLALLGGIALVSVIGGILARGKKKEAATDIANAGFAEIEEAVQSFTRRQAGFEQTTQAMERVWERMVEGWQQIGGSVGSESIRTQRPFYEAKVRQVELLEEARKTRLAFAEELPIPEFEQGGFVPGRPGEPVLIKAHAGEYVVPADRAAGYGLRDAGNTPIATPRLEMAGGGGGGTVNVTINAIDSADVAAWLKKNRSVFGPEVIRAVSRDKGDFGVTGRAA